MILYLLGIIIFLYILHIALNYNERARLIRKIPGPRDDFIVGNGWTVIRTPVEIMKMGKELCNIFNGIFRVWIWPMGAVFIYNPEDIEEDDLGSAQKLLEYAIKHGTGLLYKFNAIELRIPWRCSQVMTPTKHMVFYRDQEWPGEVHTIELRAACILLGCMNWLHHHGVFVRHKFKRNVIIMSSMKYGEKSLIYKILKPWLRDGLLVSNGAKWQERRKILTPAFHFNILKQFCDIIEENSYRFLDSLKETAGKPIDIVPVLSEFTLNSICETAMGTQLSEMNTAKSYKTAIYDIGTIFYKRFVRMYLYPDFIFNLSPMGRLQNKYLKVVHGFTENVIQQRREYIERHGLNINEDYDDDSYVYKKKKKTAMLDLLLSAEKEGHIDRIGVQEEVDTFMFEGHDTTASGLTYCFMLLANHKEIQDKIFEELKDIFGDSDRPIKMEDLPKMKYLECCIKESLRLYPPVHFISRNINEETVLSNYTVPAGTFCHIIILHLHLREDLFKNAQKFDPDRFLPENSVGRHPYSYIPFSAGPRNCIGQKFAMMEMKIAVANVMRKFELSPVTRPCDITFTADLVLRNDGPVLVNFIKREK